MTALVTAIAQVAPWTVPKPYPDRVRLFDNPIAVNLVASIAVYGRSNDVLVPLISTSPWTVTLRPSRYTLRFCEMSVLAYSNFLFS